MSSRLELANAIRALAMDAVQAANSGHPGMPMGMADIAEVLWNGHLRHNPRNPRWADRDRFVVSNGHGSMLLYSVLHLTGYDLPMAELKRFRQLHSKTPGHPEYGYAPGVETTTGPLGQGLANAVGMAIAERALAAEFNSEGHDVVDHYTYVFLGDGCLMEGISHEACSLAGTLGLSKLVAFWDDNGISIDSDKGSMRQWFTDDTPKRFEAYGWHVIPGVETTTGPLGQGLGNAVGMALAEKILAAHFNRDGHTVVDHHTYVFLGDGCLMEGISHEACSLAGTLGLGKLIGFWDDNGISIDGRVEGWFTDDTQKRFEAYGWNVIAKVDGHSVTDIDAAI